MQETTAHTTQILTSKLTTPLGQMIVCTTEKGLCLLEFIDRKILNKEFKDLERLLQSKIIEGENKHSRQVKKELAEYFSGKRKTFDIPLHMPGTDFQNTVWNALLKIPYGQTASYQEQAEKIAKPKASRAVGTANGANRIAIIVPCHRVLGKNGNLTGYGGGLERKRWLIAHESS